MFTGNFRSVSFYKAKIRFEGLFGMGQDTCRSSSILYTAKMKRDDFNRKQRGIKDSIFRSHFRSLSASESENESTFDLKTHISQMFI